MFIKLRNYTKSKNAFQKKKKKKKIVDGTIKNKVMI